MILKEFQIVENVKVSKLNYDISSAIVPFSEMLKKSFSSDVYSGPVDIPFQSRDPEYRQILKYEFVCV